jgi:hypothetical protein
VGFVYQYIVDCVWNVMAHAQKPDFVFRRNGRILKSAGASVQSTAGNRGVRISVSNAGYTTFRGSVKSTGYPLHSPVSPSLSLPCVVCHQVSNGLYTLSDSSYYILGNPKGVCRCRILDYMGSTALGLPSVWLCHCFCLSHTQELGEVVIQPGYTTVTGTQEGAILVIGSWNT